MWTELDCGLGMAMGLDVMWLELDCGLGMEMRLDVMWSELKLWFGNGDGTGCDVD